MKHKALAISLVAFIGIGGAAATLVASDDDPAAQPPPAAQVIESSIAVVASSAAPRYPPDIVRQVTEANEAIGRCVVANGGRVRRPDSQTYIYDGDTSQCRAEQKAADRLAASPAFRAARRSRFEATREMARCVAVSLGSEKAAVLRLRANEVDAATLTPCLESARAVAARSATP